MSRVDAGGAGPSKAMGPMMQMLMQYLIAADPDETDDRIREWERARNGFRQSATFLRAAARKMGAVFEETSLTTGAAERQLMKAADEYDDKAEQLLKAIDRLGPARERMKSAQDKYDELLPTLPASFGPAPNPNDPKYATSGIGISKAAGKENGAALAEAQAQHAADAAAIAKAEKEAAHHKNEMADGYNTSMPPVRAITDEPSRDGNTGSGGGSGTASNPFGTGSYSAAAAAQAKIAQGQSSIGRDGSYELIEAGRSELEAAKATNQPEWNDSLGWVSADGSPAEVTEYASIVSSEGIAPLSANASGLGGMAAVGVGLGGAGLAAGIAKAVKSGMLARSAGSAVGRTNTSTTPKTGTTTPGTRSGGVPAGRQQGTKTGGRNLTGAGNRGQAGRGATGGGRGGKGKDKNGTGAEVDYLADYGEDWDTDNPYTDEAYEQMVQRQRGDRS